MRETKMRGDRIKKDKGRLDKNEYSTSAIDDNSCCFIAAHHQKSWKQKCNHLRESSTKRQAREHKICMQTDKQTGRHTDRYSGRLHINRHTRTDRQTYRHTQTKSVAQKNRRTHTHAHRHT